MESGVASFNMAQEVDANNRSMQASLGLTAERAEELGNIIIDPNVKSTIINYSDGFPAIAQQLGYYCVFKDKALIRFSRNDNSCYFLSRCAV